MLQPTFSNVCKIKKEGKGLPIHRAGSMACAAEAIGLA